MSFHLSFYFSNFMMKSPSNHSNPIIFPIFILWLHMTVGNFDNLIMLIEMMLILIHNTDYGFGHQDFKGFLQLTHLEVCSDRSWNLLFVLLKRIPQRWLLMNKKSNQVQQSSLIQVTKWFYSVATCFFSFFGSQFLWLKVLNCSILIRHILQ